MFDVCIIGGGAAGLMLAHSLPSHYKIAVLMKDAQATSNSSLAQGGIAASLSAADSPGAHACDTLLATVNHSDPERVDILTREGASAIRALMADGLPYDSDEKGQPLLGMEGAHSMRRILHSGGDQTGKMLMSYLMKKTENRLQLFPHHQALELVVANGRCHGVIASDRAGNRNIFSARHTVLATGGIGALYSHTSNSPVAEGDGLSLAYRAGAILEDLEFVQFHPTILTLDGQSKGLISEAVRGEGALLVNGDGQRIMGGLHPLHELAPRDIVARAIEWHWQQLGPVYLDARHLPNFGSKFPAILKNCLAFGLNPQTDLLPVRPGAHFHMGGVKTDGNGATNIDGLHAIGEVASTGVHGANRLASNSLLEAIVFAKRLANAISLSGAEGSGHPVAEQLASSSPSTVAAERQKLLQQDMTRSAGILRDKNGLKQFLQKYPLKKMDQLLHLSNAEIASFHRSTTCTLLATAAYLRDESRGAHFRTDQPDLSEDWQGKIIELSLDGISFTDRKIHSKETV